MLKLAIETFRIFNKGPQVIGGSSQLIDNIGVTPDEFYSLLAEIIEHNRFQKIKVSQVSKNEGWFSPFRKYTRIKYKSFFFDILFLPQQYNCFISWQLFRNPNRTSGIISKIPDIGTSLHQAMQDNSNEPDSHILFKESMQKCILFTIEELKKKKISRTSSSGTKKNWQDFYKKL